ncbi:type III pantothenate kinase [bacterium]|nr:type III pantothenate kinase [bacterium]
MELLFDVGNTHTVIGLHLGNERFQTWRVGTRNFNSEDELFVKLFTFFQTAGKKMAHISAVGISSVVPPVNFMIKKLADKYFHKTAHFLTCDQSIFDIEYHVDNPAEIGADRLANIIASRKLFGPNVICLDFGTAITMDVLRNGHFVGGAILPGFQTSMMALFQNAALLPQIEFNVPDYCIGTNTVDNLQIGLLKVPLLGIERLIEQIQNQAETKFEIITTGGLGKVMVTKSTLLKNYDADLTLKGILYFLENTTQP